MPWAPDCPRVVQGPLRSRRRWTGQLARAQLQCSLDLASPVTPQAIYVHVPFCRPRCRFCDLCCLAIDPHAGGSDLDAFCSAFEREARWYAARRPLARRPVSTMHLGGGTPMILGARRLGRVIGTCRALFGLGRETEIAIEVRASDLSPATLAAFASLGIGRVHVGVQTLNAERRAMLDRIGNAQFVLGGLAKLLHAGSVVSADVLYGLPDQGADELTSDLARLCDCGVHGVALYELHKTDRNRRLFEDVWRYTPDRRRNFELLSGGSRFLQSRGYARGFFNHFAKGPDRDLYSSHPIRGEECLAFGPWADGHGSGAGWRNAPYGRWLDAVRASGCGIGEVSLYLQAENALREIETGLMHCQVSEDSLRRFASGVNIDADGLIGEWTSAGLADLRDRTLLLTDKGAWLHGNMIEALRRHAGRATVEAEQVP